MANFSQNLLFFTLPVFGNQSQDRFANDLFWFVSKDALGALVPIGDGSIQSFSRDRVAGGLNYRGQAHGSRLCALALGDVKKGIDCSGDFAVNVRKNSRSRNHVSPLTIRTFD